MESETIVFLPWLRLKHSIEAFDLLFLPIGEKIGWSSLPSNLIQQAQLIASSYTDQAGHPIPDFTIALKRTGEKPWNLSSEEFSQARDAASILFFCSWSMNDYYSQLGHYANSSMFNVVGQRFAPTDPTGIALTIRRRDGETLCGGFQHGQVRLVSPPQYAINHHSHVDTNLLDALMKARNSGSKTYDLLFSVLGLLELANTDRDFMSLPSEVILMSSTFETFLEVNGNRKALVLSESFASLFSQYSSLTARDALNKGRNIFLDAKEGAENNWPILKVWSHEFYKLRNEFVHSKKTSNRTWGWHELEHLVMGAFTFPLMVKLKLHAENYYSLTYEDTKRCKALDTLLATPDWPASEHPGSIQNTWRDILSDAY